MPYNSIGCLPIIFHRLTAMYCETTAPFPTFSEGSPVLGHSTLGDLVTIFPFILILLWAEFVQF